MTITNRRTLIALLAGSVVAYILIPAFMLVHQPMRKPTTSNLQPDALFDNSALVDANLLMGGAILFFKHYTNNEQDSEN